MKTINNEIKIIQILLSSNDYISTYEIATLIGVSRRSVREEINNVKNILKEHNIHLTSKPNKGYIIEEKTPVIINKLQEIINENENAYAPVPNMPHDRVNFILKLLAQSDKYIKMDDIADELLVSRATIANDLINVKKELSRYNIHIIHKPNYGIKLNIKELERRRIIADLVFASMTQREVFYDFLDTYLDTSDREIIEIIKNNNLYISDLSLADILINYSISIARNMAGHPLDTVFEDFEIFKNTKEYHTVLDLSRVAKEHFDVDFNDSEKSFLTLMLICKGSTHDKIYQEDQITSKLTHTILDDIYSSTLIHIDNRYYDRLSLYIQTALLRQKYQEKTLNLRKLLL